MIVDERLRLRLRRRLGLSVRPPRGWETGPPDFVGIGAQRSGTSWWFGQILRHPAVVAPSGKELHYFDRFWNAEFTATDGDGYRALFPRPPGKLTGEWTPRYMYDPWTLPLLQSCAPTAKILVLLRDPWDRFISGLGHERRVFARELRGRRERDLGLMIRADAFRRSIYSDQIRNVLRHVDRSRLLILQYERCVTEPEAELGRTLEFLDLDPVPIEIEKRGPTAGNRRAQLPVAIADELRETLAADVDRLVEIAPEIDPELWPSAR
jgi:hypothetical protein